MDSKAPPRRDIASTMAIGAVLLPTSDTGADAQVPPPNSSSAAEKPGDQRPSEPSPYQSPGEGHLAPVPEPVKPQGTTPSISNLLQDATATRSLPESTHSNGNGAQDKTVSWVESQQFDSPLESNFDELGQGTAQPNTETEKGHGTPPQDVPKNAVDTPEPSPCGTDSSFKAGHKRPESMVMSPLTHPNGMSMFPDLSTFEQDIISREALFEAEDTIVADSEEVSTIGESRSDAGYESDSVTSGSTSMSSSIRDYMYENGRRYHRFREGTYNFPNDDVEQEREDMKHAMVKLLCNQKLNFAPIGDHPQEVLDIGTGTGIWAIEMGDQYSSANILGVDLSPIQPDWLPPNVRFMVDDVESPWLHPRNHFDYIHTRHTVMGIKDWPRLFRRALEHMKPGGWFEMQEIHHKPHSATRNGAVPPEHPIAKYWALVTEGLAALGVNFHAAANGNLANMMREAGFINVTERVFHVPLGTWPKNKVLKTVGLYWRTILMDGMQAIALGPLTRGLRWSPEQVEMLLVDVRRAYNSNTMLMYMPCHIVYGQKP
ncbi:S-adenosyl-L-methionine-dependent methyltransferase [Dactylonectria macrodidyma]|uniref:S-adenosyl-L-methionine-dependent methyltransferase n=1 Tax=Dactylonectria macrodidyma TaxID=307937 RepID=A0A9P9JMU4_9HYPO|nr:S-adenosyl-L-methionine-dependent methyltransferase [Dactylonectria macrodidyma]